MDEESLSLQFFEWIDEVEDSVDCIILFESIERGTLFFLLDSHAVKMDLSTGKFSSISSSSTMKNACEAVSAKLESKREMISSGKYPLKIMLNSMAETYVEFRDFEDDEDSSEDYEAEIKSIVKEEIARKAQVLGAPIEGGSQLSARGQKHFIFREVDEAIELLNMTIQSCSCLEFSCRILNNSVVSNVRIEIDLSFLDISDSAMVMLGLNYDSPLVISISMNEISILQTLDAEEWSPSLMGLLKILVLQGGVADSYGCRDYVTGRVNKYREEVYKLVTAHCGMPPVLSLSREPSVEGEVNEFLQILLDMGYDFGRARDALDRTNNDLEAAIDQLSSELYNGQYSEAVFQTNNFFYNLLFYLRDRLQNCTNYCVICYKKHESESTRLKSCSKEICEFRFEEVIGFSLYAELQTYPEMVELDLSFASSTLLSSRAQSIFEPFPSFLLIKNQNRGKSGFFDRSEHDSYACGMDSNKDMDQLKRLMSEIPTLDALKSAPDDDSLKQLFTRRCSSDPILSYKLAKYIVATNRLTIVKLGPHEVIAKVPASIEQFIVADHPSEILLSFNKMKAKHGSFFAFHGSPIENWYSILRNGIRSLSNTHLMTTGAARGAGVYTGDNINMSLNYCKLGSLSGGVWPSSKFKSAGCIAIVEIIDNQPEYKSHTDMYVVKNDRDLILRYLLIIQSQHANSINFSANALNLQNHLKEFEESHFQSQNAIKRRRIESAIRKAKKLCESEEVQKERWRTIEEEEKKDTQLDQKLEQLADKFSGHGSAMANKRILQEYKYFIKSKECKGLGVEFSEENMYIWLVTIDPTQWDLSKALTEDLANYSAKAKQAGNIIFEVRFDSNFPYSPPFVRLVRPRFAFHTGHVTIGGSICMESLTPSGWIPVRTVESIFIEILYNMIEGEARLDLRTTQDYTLAEAQEAFRRVARQHNWI